MKVEFRKSFLQDIKKLHDKRLQALILQCIEHVESAESINEVRNLKKLRGYEQHYRIRIGDYRIGKKVLDEVVFLWSLNTGRIFTKAFPETLFHSGRAYL